MFAKFISGVAGVSTVFPIVAEWGTTAWAHCFSCMRSPAGGVWVVSTFWLLQITLLQTSMYKFLGGCMFSLLGHYGNSVFNFFKNCQTVCLSGCIIVHSARSVRRFRLFHLVISTCHCCSGIRRIWVCISLMTHVIGNFSCASGWAFLRKLFLLFLCLNPFQNFPISLGVHSRPLW